MSKKLKWSLIGVVPIAFLVSSVWPYLPIAKRHAQQQFKTRCTARLISCRSLHDVQALSFQKQVEKLNTRVFEDGSWAATAWHSAHDAGGEWDGAVLLDSKGQLFWSGHHFCGHEGFEAEFLGLNSQSLQRFYEVAKFKMSPIGLTCSSTE